MNVLIWHAHGSWTTSFVQGRHTYLLPTDADGGPDGRGRAETWTWPESAVEVTPQELADADVDVVIVQRARDLELAHDWLGGRRPGHDIPLVWLEHNAPQGAINAMCHPAADIPGCTVVHVTHTNALFWDTGSASTHVIEHGVPDPGDRASFEVGAAGVVINEPLRRGRVVGTDLLAGFADVAPLDVFGMQVRGLDAVANGSFEVRAHDGLSQDAMHTELARRVLYLHPFRWTSLGMALIEAMMLGLPVVALATTEVPRAVPRGCGVISNDVAELHCAVRAYLDDPDLAATHGAAARDVALERYGLDRFLGEWDRLLEELR